MRWSRGSRVEVDATVARIEKSAEGLAPWRDATVLHLVGLQGSSVYLVELDARPGELWVVDDAALRDPPCVVCDLAGCPNCDWHGRSPMHRLRLARSSVNVPERALGRGVTMIVIDDPHPRWSEDELRERRAAIADYMRSPGYMLPPGYMRPPELVLPPFPMSEEERDRRERVRASEREYREMVAIIAALGRP